MATVSPQLNITNAITLTQSQILTLYSEPIVICAAEEGYINIFQSAMLMYSYKNAPFTDVNNILNFQLVPTVGDNILVSNSLGGSNILGLSQSSSISFIPANPYTSIMSTSSNAAIILTIAGNDPLGGDANSTLTVSVTYSILQA